MGEDVPGPVIEDSPTSAAQEPAVKRGWRPSRMLVIIVSVVLGAAILGILAWVIVDQTTRVSVPAAEGETLAAGTTLLEDAGFAVKVETNSKFCGSDPLADDLCVVTSQAPAAAERVHADIVTVKVVPAEVDVPDMEGMTFSEARDAGAEVGLAVRPLVAADGRVDGHEEWPVLEQLESGTTAGSSVKVRLERPLVDAPVVVGVSLQTAMTALREAGFNPSASIDNSATGIHPAWVVTESDPAAVDGKLPLGSTVKLTWGVQVPNVVGMSETEATKVLTDAHLTPRGAFSSSRSVASQVPAAGTIVNLLAEVTVTVEEASTVYEVVGNGSRATITWIPPHSYSISQAANEPLPWRMSFPTDSDYANFNAQMMNGDSITCNIYVNGKLVKTNTSTGPYAVVSCG